MGYSYLGSMGLLDAFGTMQAVFNRLGAHAVGTVDLRTAVVRARRA